MKLLEYKLTNDVLFKMLFMEHKSLLKKLVAVLLAIPLKSITNLKALNSEIPPESLGEKFCRLDINMKVNGQPVDLEVQVAGKDAKLASLIADKDAKIAELERLLSERK